VRDGETGFLVEHGDVPALSAAILRLLEDEALWWRMGRAAVTWAAEYHWDRSTRETLELARTILAERKGR
jgi:glycosyltransferase involved in cell wall biosynthesis